MQIIDSGGAGAVPSLAIDGGGAADVPRDVVDGGPAGWQHYTSGALGGTPTPRPAFQGDPRLVMTQNGTRLQFVGGQPLMDRGLENLVLISLFTHEGWCGNRLMKTPIGSGFMPACNQPITRQSINRVRAAAEAALVNPALGRVAVTVTNPTGQQLRVHIVVEPPASNPQELVLTRNGANWYSQRTEPAYPQVQRDRWRKALVPENSSALRDENGVTLEF